jgi:DNA-binding NarL/FixJ family response regulator
MGRNPGVGEIGTMISPQAPGAGTPNPPARKRVLVVDDSSGFRGLLQMFLSSVPEVEVVGEAADGVEAITAVLRTKPDLVLMDVRMPALNGLQATKRLRIAGESARIVLLSAYGDAIPRWLAHEVGADDVLDKSCLGERLRDALAGVSSPIDGKGA